MENNERQDSLVIWDNAIRFQPFPNLVPSFVSPIVRKSYTLWGPMIEINPSGLRDMGPESTMKSTASDTEENDHWHSA